MMLLEMQRDRTRRIRRTIMKVALLTSQRRRRSVWERPKSTHWWDAVVPTFNDDRWLENFRLRKGTFDFICSKVEPILLPDPMPVIPGRSLSVDKIVAIALYKLSHVAEYQVVGNLFGVHKSSVHNCLYGFCLALIHLLGDEYIRMPDEEEAAEIARHFKQQCNIPQVIGAIDGSHIPLTAPEDGHQDFVNRKMFPSIVLQGIVDHQYLFRNISCRLPGSCHDADVLRESIFYKNLETKIPRGVRDIDGRNIPYLILGDPAFPLEPWLMKNYPYNANTTELIDSFNVYLNKGRVVDENAFGRLKGRWRILCKRTEVDYEFVLKIVAACCILHSICEMSKDTFNATWLKDVREAEILYPPDEPEPYDNENSPAAVDIRHHLMLYLSRNFETLSSIRGRIAAM